MLLLVEQIKEIYFDKEEESPYTNNIERIDPFGNAEYAEKANRKQVNPDRVRSIYIRSRSRIQLNQSGFKVIRFTNSKKEQAGEPIRNEEFMAYLADTPIVLNDNNLLFRNNVEYTWAKFMQDSKITKRSIEIFFNNSDLTSMQEHLSYKSIDEMKALLTELPYNKVTW